MKSRTLPACRLLSSLLVTVLFSSAFLPARPVAARASSSQDNQIDSNEIKSQPIVTNDRDGSKFLEDMTARIKQLGAYRFDGLLGTVKEKNLRLDAGAFYYMPKECLRVEVKGAGYKAGSVLVKQKNGVIRAKGGPALLGMKMNLEPDSNMLRLPNGLSIINCDFLSLLKWLKTEIATGQKVYASEGPLLIGSQANRVLVLETRAAGQSGSGAVAHRILVDPQQLVPLEWDIFKEGKFFSTVRFRNFQVCPGIDESLFQL